MLKLIRKKFAFKNKLDSVYSFFLHYFCFQIFGGMPCLKAIKLVLPPISNPCSCQNSKIPTKLAEITPIWQTSHKTGKTPTKLAKVTSALQKPH